MGLEPVIAMREVSHFYGSGLLRKQILFDITTDIFPGEIVILTGPSGSGKTTLLTMAGALRSVEHGSLRVLGLELNGASRGTRSRIREDIGFIFQAHNLLEALTACQNVQMAVPERGRGARAMGARMLEAVGLGNRVDYYPEQLSGGQKQRVAIARALVRRPRIILADEPTAALDKKSGREVVELLQELSREQGCAILLVTHDNRILDVADRILTLEDGRLASFAASMTSNAGHLLAAFSQLHRKGELLRHIEAISGKQFLEMLEKMTAEFEEFLRATDLGQREAVQALFEDLLVAVAVKIKDLLDAERATVFLVDRERKVLRSKVATTGGGAPLSIEIPITTGVAGRVARTNQALNITDPYSHPDFNPEVDRATGYRTRNILCTPIRNRQNDPIAVAQLLNKRDAESFSAADERRLDEISDSLALILESCRRLETGGAVTTARASS